MRKDAGVRGGPEMTRCEPRHYPSDNFKRHLFLCATMGCLKIHCEQHKLAGDGAASLAQPMELKENHGKLLLRSLAMRKIAHYVTFSKLFHE
ncbi:hypothetical protein CDAR_46111 [Caerostris darwini]|uniref:Uncharacterized protein n=1 Tax=Caerostris darwini TaxID=1538125 RepID=A0AAV4U143_9ARAC|nr:hypothetical protein CDAR_46111 [Caerostris darwini]